MPVKDSIETTEKAIRAIVSSGNSLTVYDDNSSAETVMRLQQLHTELGITIVHINEYTDHPSPNYRWILIEAQKKALEEHAALVIIESDVIIRPDTIEKMGGAVTQGVGMVAATTCNESGHINFPYKYAKHIKQDGVCKKRLSFCCTLLTEDLLQQYSFENLDETKNWYDVFITHQSLKLGLQNILQISNLVLHNPHSSRPWKKLKYSNPILYYWRKLTQHLDKI